MNPTEDQRTLSRQAAGDPDHQSASTRSHHCGRPEVRTSTPVDRSTSCGAASGEDPSGWDTGVLYAGAQPQGHGLERLGEAASVEKFIPLIHHTVRSLAGAAGRLSLRMGSHRG